MRIIHNLILKNQLQKQLDEIENTLQRDGYYDKEYQLLFLRYHPDEYAQLCEEIESQYGILLRKKDLINKQLAYLKGVNLFKKHDFDYVK